MKNKIKPARNVMDEKRTSELIQANKELTLLYEKQKFTELQLLHINTVLKAIRNVNQLITKERNPSILIREACQKLVEGRGYHYARIVTIDKHNNLIEYADAALNDNYKIESKIENLDDLPFCMQQALNQREVFIADKSHAGCMQCSSGLEEVDCYSLSLRLEYENKIYGLLSVSIPLGFVFDKEEESLFLELAGDISFALASIESEELRKKSEKSLELFRKLIDQSNDAIEVLDPETGRFLDVNEKGCMELGYSREEFLALSVFDIDPMVDPKIFENVREELRKTGHLLWEGFHLRKDGSTFPVEVNIKYVNMDREYIITVARDITERKLAEKKFQESEERYSSIVNNSPNIVLIHQNGIIQYINKLSEKVLGYTVEESMGKQVLDFLTDNSKALVMKNMERRAKGEDVPAYEAEIIKKSGEVISMLIQVTMIPHQKEQTSLVVLTDISEIKKYQNELKIAKDNAEELNRVKSHFFSNMSHEMRTPMIGILGFANLLVKEAQNEEQREMAETIVSSGKRLMDTLNLILDLSQVEAGKQSVMINEVSLPYVVYDAVELFTPEASQKNLYLNTNILDEEVTANLDESLMIKIANNLINNAIKFTNKGGVTVEVDSIVRGPGTGEREIGIGLSENEEKLAVIRVIDTGIGIAKESLIVIFEEFRQASEGKDRNFDGTGLGLTITKKYVELMGGKISIESKVGFGSIFTVTFPALNYKLKKQTVEGIRLTNEESRKLKGEVSERRDLKVREQGIMDNCQKPATVQGLPKILLVEDDIPSRILTERYLKGLCMVDFTSDGETAVEMAKKDKYLAFIMDINLGKGLSGLDVTSAIRSLPEYKDTPIIAMTAYAMKGDKEEFLAAGCSHYISKPFEPEDIIALIKEALGFVD